jgi:hypothetical protein
MAFPQSLGHVMSFSRKSVHPLMKEKHASKGCAHRGIVLAKGEGKIKNNVTNNRERLWFVIIR